MDWDYRFNCLNLSNNAFIYQDVESETCLDEDLFVANGYVYLPSTWNATFREFITQARFIRRFKQSWSQRPMDFDRRINYLRSYNFRTFRTRSMQHGFHLRALRVLRG